MAAVSFECGTEVSIDGLSYRIHRKISEQNWQLEETRTKRIVTLSESQILSKFMDRELIFPGNGVATHCGPANIELSEKDFETAKVRRAYVIRVLDLPNTPERYKTAIDEVWIKIKIPQKAPSFSSVYRWKSRYIASKSDIRALVDNTSAKGNRTSRYGDEVVEICRKAIEAKWLRRERPPLQDAVNEAILGVTEENQLRLQTLALKSPTRRLVKRLVNEIPAIDKYSARYGREAARKTFRSVKGHVVTNAPLERAEIDHTLMDFFVIDDRTRLPLGRPYLTVCIDDYARCVLGLYVGFNPPSFYTVAKCLKDCFMPKVRLREEYPEIRSEWPAYGVMKQLILDNGQEFHSTSLEQVCLSLGITMQFAPRRTP